MRDTPASSAHFGLAHLSQSPEGWTVQQKPSPAHPRSGDMLSSGSQNWGFSEFWNAVLETINIGLPICFFRERILRKQVPLTTVISKKIIQNPELIRVISRIQGWFFKSNTLPFVKNFLPWNFILVFYLRPLRPLLVTSPSQGSV